MEEIINRGDLYYADLSDHVIGSEQAGSRPVVILQNNTGNFYGKTIIVAPITSREIDPSKLLPTHVCLQPSKKKLSKKSVILTEQVRVIDRSRLKYYMGTLDIDEIRAVDKALIIALGIAKIRTEEFKNNEKQNEEKIEYLTRKQIAAYGIVAKEYLKRAGNLEISNKLFGDYMLTLMDLFKPDEIEQHAEKYRNN